MKKNWKCSQARRKASKKNKAYRKRVVHFILNRWLDTESKRWKRIARAHNKLLIEVDSSIEHKYGRD